MDPQSYLIVGSGVFGASTALHLVRRHRGKAVSVTLVDRHAFPNPSAASSDLNKIIRADYDDLLYMKLGLEAQKLWRTDPIYKPYYHESGMLFAEDMGMGKSAFENYQALGIDHEAEILTPAEARARFPLFSEADWTDVKECFYNPSSGWGEGEGALRSLVQAAVDEGAVFKQAAIKKLIFDVKRTSCLGVELQNGEKLFADCTVLCTGAYTAQVLADSAPNWQELQVGNRMIAAGAVQCQATYDPKEEERFSSAPVHFIGMWHTHGESIPPLNGVLKMNCEVSFTNMVCHKGLQQDISVPPERPTQSTFSEDVPDGLKQEVANVVRRTYGNSVRGLKIISYRMCWDAVTPNQDWIIDSHPHCKNLYVAGGGSFHSWKFLPILGALVVDKLEGRMDEEISRKWAWDRPNSGAACVMYLPTRDLKTVGPFEGWPKVKISVTGETLES